MCVFGGAWFAAVWVGGVLCDGSWWCGYCESRCACIASWEGCPPSGQWSYMNWTRAWHDLRLIRAALMRLLRSTASVTWGTGSPSISMSRSPSSLVPLKKAGPERDLQLPFTSPCPPALGGLKVCPYTGQSPGLVYAQACCPLPLPCCDHPFAKPGTAFRLLKSQLC